MRSILVLGLGNRLMMDDGIGVAVVEALAGRPPGDGRVTWAIGETDFEYCLGLAAAHDYLIVVDAALTGKAPGEVSVFPLDAAPGGRSGVSAHDVHFLDLLHQSDQGKAGVLLGIEPAEICLHWGLSRCLSDGFDRIVEAVWAIVERLGDDLVPNCPLG